MTVTIEERTTRLVPVTPEARAKAIRRALRDDSKVQVVVTDPRTERGTSVGRVWANGGPT